MVTASDVVWLCPVVGGDDALLVLTPTCAATLVGSVAISPEIVTKCGGFVPGDIAGRWG